MATRHILVKGDELLLKRSKQVTKFDKRLHTMLDDMWDTLREAQGVGLAAPQIGVLKRVFIADDGETKLECINPVILSTEGEREVREGCLSLPDLVGYVVRPESVTMRAQDRDGNFFTVTAGDLLGQCLCHEYDHLDGILYDTKVTRFVDPEEENAEPAGEE
ncbi:MAG: peptide deformylase [Clostridia bacterium]|nr:peptide deformylase [Clostridia bacterium]